MIVDNRCAITMAVRPANAVLSARCTATNREAISLRDRNVSYTERVLCAAVNEEAAAQIAELMSRTNRRIRRAAEKELEPIGVTPGQVRALRALAHGPLRVSALARRLDVVPRSATSVVDDLESEGMVIRTPDPDDRRAILVAVTDHGRRVLTELRARRRAGMAELLSDLSDDDQAELVRLLRLLAGRPTES